MSSKPININLVFLDAIADSCGYTEIAALIFCTIQEKSEP